MLPWLPYAFVRITIFFAGGVILGICTGDGLNSLWIALICVCAAMLFLSLALLRRGRSLAAGVLCGLALTSGGVLNVRWHDQSRDEGHLTSLNIPITAMQIMVRGPGLDRPRTTRYDVVIEQVYSEGQWIRAFSRSLLYIRKDSLAAHYGYGDRLLIRDHPRRIDAPRNPGEFNNQQFQRYRQVFFQVTTEPARVVRIGVASRPSLMRYALTARLWAERVIGRHVKGTRASAITQAFVLGVTDGLDQELMNAYASTGVTHVLSVSGLHVGIVYWLLLVLFKPFASPGARWPMLVVSLAVLWSYACVTGVSPSVLRAVLMFSFAAVARAWRLPLNIYNILAATACLLLAADPFMIMSIGFQLSFIAVLGIVALQPLLYRMWEPTAWLYDEGWKICSVSIAAQVATLPLCLYYFHQFPNYFLLSNLFMVPGSFAVLMLGIVLLLVSGLPLAAQVVGWLLEVTVNVLNFLVLSVEKLPASVIDNILVTPLQVVLLSALVAGSIVWLEGRRPAVLVFCMAVVAALPVLSWYHALASASPRLVVYAISGGSAVDLIAGHVTVFVGAPPLMQARAMMPNRIRLQSADRIEPVRSMTLMPGCEVLVWKGKTIVWVSRALPADPGPGHDFHPIEADIVVISNDAVRNLSAFSRSIVAKCYVIDGSNRRALADRLTRQATQHSARVHDVMRRGAFELRL